MALYSTLSVRKRHSADSQLRIKDYNGSTRAKLWSTGIQAQKQETEADEPRECKKQGSKLLQRHHFVYY